MNYHGSFIDFHVHLFPERLYRAVVAWFTANTEWRFAYTRPWEEAVQRLEGMERLNRYVCFGYAHKPGVARELNGFMAEVSRRSPKAVALMSAHQDDADLGGLAEEGFAAGLKGVKIHCQVQRVSPSDRRFDPLYEKIIENRGLALFHAGTGPFPGEGTGFDNLVPLLDRFPELTVVVAHLGCFEEERFLREALKRPNLYLDTSYTFVDNPTNRMDAPLPLVREASEKILFASDFPGICHTYEEALDAIGLLDLTDEERERIFLGNAEKLLAGVGVRP